jgi:hypothetical protein
LWLRKYFPTFLEVVQCPSSGPAVEEDLNCWTLEMLTLRSIETSHPRTLSSATSLYRKLKPRTLSTCDVTHLPYLDFGSKGVSVKTVSKTCMLVRDLGQGMP